MKKLPVWEYSYLIHSPCQDVKIIYRSPRRGASGLFYDPKGRMGERAKKTRVTPLETPDAARWIKRFHRAVFLCAQCNCSVQKSLRRPCRGLNF